MNKWISQQKTPQEIVSNFEKLFSPNFSKKSLK